MLLLLVVADGQNIVEKIVRIRCFRLSPQFVVVIQDFLPICRCRFVIVSTQLHKYLVEPALDNGIAILSRRVTGKDIDRQSEEVRNLDRRTQSRFGTACKIGLDRSLLDARGSS